MAMASTKLRFQFDETPKWRDGNPPVTTSEMLKQITKWRTEYRRLPRHAKDFCEQQFARAMAVDYIHNLNVGEMVGTQTHEDTLEALEKFFEGAVSSSGEKDTRNMEKEKKETINTYKAMKRFEEIRKEMEDEGLLTVQLLCDVHGILLQGLHQNCGKVRTCDVYTNWHDGVHYYPKADRIEELFLALVDRHNIYMEARKKLENTSNEYTIHIFKCASRLLFEFVDTHPFNDGNGRMCRLLANYVVSLITPFPVSLYHTYHKGRSGRDDYLNAIVRCRENPEEGPSGLAAMLVEGAWRGWENLFKNLEKHCLLEPGDVIGPIVVQKSTCNESYVSERVHRILSKRSVNAEEKKVVTLILGATQDTDVSTLNHDEYVERTVRIADGVSAKLDVYGP